MKYYKVENYTMKLRLYPTKKQKEMFDIILHETKAYHNNTVYQIMNLNPDVVNESVDENGNVYHWVNISKKKGTSSIFGAKWKSKMLSDRNNGKYIPSTGLLSKGSIAESIVKSFNREGNNKKKIPIEGIKPHYYSKSKPIKSFLLDGMKCSRFSFSDNPKVAYLNMSRNIGKVKMRGINKKLRFDSTYTLSMKDFFESGGYRSTKNEDNPAKLTCRVIKDNCGDYFISITLPYVYKPMNTLEEQHEGGVDMGVKEKAIVYDATNNTFEHKPNEMYMHKNDGSFKDSDLSKRLEYLNLLKSRKWGYCNKEFRKANKESGYTLKPSKGYSKVDMEYKKLHRYIARRREAYNHKLSTDLVNKFKFISIETLDIAEWFSKKLFNGGEHFTKEECNKLSSEKKFRKICSDTGLSMFIDMLKYKTNRYGNILICVDKYYASSQTCSCCGYKNTDVKDTSIRKWTCPVCGSIHDRDENAAVNMYIEGLRLHKESLNKVA